MESILKGRIFTVALLAATFSTAVLAQNAIPVLVPITGPFALEGGGQRNGALLAIKNAPKSLVLSARVTDTGASPEGAATALERELGRSNVPAVAASIIGPQMLAMMPIALENKVPLLTVSGTASLTEKGNPYVFRFFPGDAVAKAAHVRYVVEEMKKKRVAVVYQTTAYGQGGRAQIVEQLKAVGLAPVIDEALEVSVKDMSAVLGKVQAANPDVVMLHLHSGPTALFLKQAAVSKLSVPIVAGSGLSQPSTAALLEPAELKNTCSETNASPVATGNTPEMAKFLQEYRAEFGVDPDGFAVGQYDAVSMLIDAISKGITTRESLTKHLASATYQGLAMTYKSDGKGNMAASALIICYDGTSRTPKIVKRYN